MLVDAEKFRAEDEQVREKHDHMSKLQYCAKNMLKFVESPQFAYQLSNELRTDITQRAQEALTWLASNKGGATVSDIYAKQKALDEFFLPLMSKLVNAQNAGGSYQRQETGDADREAPQTDQGHGQQMYGGYPDLD